MGNGKQVPPRIPTDRRHQGRGREELPQESLLRRHPNGSSEGRHRGSRRTILDGSVRPKRRQDLSRQGGGARPHGTREDHRFDRALPVQGPHRTRPGGALRGPHHRQKHVRVVAVQVVQLQGQGQTRPDN